MLVSNVAEEPNLLLRRKHGHAECVDRSVTKAFVVEATAAVEPAEIALVGLASEEAQISNLKVREELAVIVVTAAVLVQQPLKVRLWVDQLRVCIDKGASARPQRWEGARIVEDVHVEAILHIVVSHEAEHIVVDVAEEVHLGKDTKIRAWSPCMWHA